LTSFQDRLQAEPALLMDGGLGTELSRRGFALDAQIWSAEALISRPELVEQIHHDYILAGAELITANTFRTHRRSLAQAAMGHRARDLTVQAVQLARTAGERAKHRVWVAGSQAPVEDCYTPADVPGDEALAIEHREMAENLAAASVDLILVETQNTIREAVAAARAASETGLPVLVSFVCRSDGRLLSGETLTEAASAVLPFQPAGILVNCLPAAAVPEALNELKSVVLELPIGAYANVGTYDEQQGWIETAMKQPANYATEAMKWRDMGARFLGGCCGTTPEHIRIIHQRLNAAN
jgi:homocysteine S-methyltransferase